MKDVTISVTDYMLQFSGERNVEWEDAKDGYHLREVQYGKFSRTFTLPSYVNPEEAKAGYDRGVLTITVPKQEKASLVLFQSKLDNWGLAFNLGFVAMS